MKEIKGIIDHFEDEYAVIEMDEETRNVQRDLLPPEAKVGDVVTFTEKEILVDREETERRKNKIKGLMDDVWKD